jgi:hypothetical protein
VLLAVLLVGSAPLAAETVTTSSSIIIQQVPRPVGVVIPSGDDAFLTSPKGSTVLDFVQDPLPAGFFGAHSLPFAGRIVIDGTPLATNPAGALGNADTLVRRLDDSAAIPVGGSDTVALAIAALSLDAVAPFQVDFDDGTTQWSELWTLSAGLSPSVPQSNGTMTIHRTHTDGGTYDSTLPVKLLLKYTRVSPLPQAVVFQDCGLGQCEEMVFNATGASWTLIGGPGGFDPDVKGIDPLPPGVQVDIDHNGTPDITTLGRSNLQVGVIFTGGGGGGGEGDCDGTAHINGQSKIETHTTFLSQDSDADGQPNDCDPCPNDPEDQCEPDCTPTDGGTTGDATGEPTTACPQPTEV